jgi:hypothetical protein
MTDRPITPNPTSDVGDTVRRRDIEERPATRTGDAPKASPDRDPSAPPDPDSGRSNPLTREGPDAPDAADLEDPDEQL